MYKKVIRQPLVLAKYQNNSNIYSKIDKLLYIPWWNTKENWNEYIFLCNNIEESRIKMLSAWKEVTEK